MTDYNNILTLPQRCIVDKKLTKAFFLKNYVLTASEKKLLTEKVERMQWLAMISPSNANIAAVKTPEYDFSLINVFVITLHGTGINPDGPKAIQLLQKYLPDQAMVIVQNEFEFAVSTCDKRINQADKSKRTIEHYYFTPALSKLFKNELQEGLFEAMAFDNLDKTNLETLYKGYVQALTNYQTAQLTGSFKKRSGIRSEEDMQLLKNIEQLENEMTSLKAAIKKENNLNEQVNLNVAINKRKQEIEQIKKQLSEE